MFFSPLCAICTCSVFLCFFCLWWHCWGQCWVNTYRWRPEPWYLWFAACIHVLLPLQEAANSCSLLMKCEFIHTYIHLTYTHPHTSAHSLTHTERKRGHSCMMSHSAEVWTLTYIILLFYSSTFYFCTYVLWAVRAFSAIFIVFVSGKEEDNKMHFFLSHINELLYSNWFPAHAVLCHLSFVYSKWDQFCSLSK